jgi:hypothetical protein
MNDTLIVLLEGRGRYQRYEFKVLVHAMQVLYHLRNAPSFLGGFLLYFSDSVLHFCTGQASNHDPPTFSSRVAGMTGVSHTTLSLL